jgi:hypothetical protein
MAYLSLSLELLAFYFEHSALSFLSLASFSMDAT